ncbi:hypothetical protein P8452_68126 [Trifolium repens]|nr:hypothetical protein P8452_68126 [Trifolium repens]
MDILKFLFHLFILFPVIYTSQIYCQDSRCSNKDTFFIRFPFQLEVESDQHPYCGYSGFKLTCTKDNQTVLTLPYSGVFNVRSINYRRQQIQVYDPHHCLLNRLLSLNLSGSPFFTEFLTNYTLLSCTTRNIGFQVYQVDCLSNFTHFVSVIPSASFTDSLPQSCYIIRNLSVPVPRFYHEFFLDSLSEDLELTWSSPDCRYCESQYDMCRFESRNSDQVHCFSINETGHSKHGYKIIIFSIIGIAMMCAIGIGCLKRFKRGRTVSTEPAITSNTSRTEEGMDESDVAQYTSQSTTSRT